MGAGSQQYTLSWAEAAEMGAELAGGKGWNLGRLDRYGFRVTPGLVLSTSAYQEFINQNGLTSVIEELSEEINLTNLEQYEGRLSALRDKIMAGALPAPMLQELLERLTVLDIADKALAVRSSASIEDSDRLSFAGIHDSFLNVRDADAIINAIKGCYASLWTPQAVAYRRRFDLVDSAVIPAVVIMQMVEARASGIAFSCDPQTGRPDRLVVQANFGLGESIVSGAIEPDCYYLDASAWYALPPLVECRIGTKQGITQINPAGGTIFINEDNLAQQQVLLSEEIQQLGRLILRVFEALGEGEHHVDIEWAYDGEEFYLLQSRPVTALPSYTFEGFRGKKEVWSNGNYREAMPMVLSPLHRRTMKNVVDLIQYTSLEKSGYPIPEGLQFSSLFNGRLYCNISTLMWAYWDCFGGRSQDFTPFWGGHQPDIDEGDADPYQGECGQIRQQRGMKNFGLMMEAAAQAATVFAEVTNSVESLSADGFSSLPDDAFIRLFNEIGAVIRDYSERFNFLAGYGSMTMMLLLQKLAPYLGEKTLSITNGLMVGGESGITSADHGYQLLELAEMAREDQRVKELLLGTDFNPLNWERELPEGLPFKAAFSSFIEEFGHRALYELDIINPRWHEDPGYLFDMIRSTMAQADVAQYKINQIEKVETAWQEVRDKVPEGDWDALKLGIKEAQQGAAVREMTKSVLVRALEFQRMMALELGKRMQQRRILDTINDIFFCSWPDLIGILTGVWDGDGIKTLISDRQESHQRKEMLPAPDLIIEHEPVFCEPLVNAAGNYLQGVGASTGRASGLARIIIHPAEGNRLHPGEVLVAPSTDPAWTPLFLKASALIMETGGYLSHGSIVAREYGVPAVVNVAGVLRRIADGQTVTVDGDQGRVYLTEENIG